ncbi:MAG TPA: MFS transporter [Patescibacteria group bacterium]|nr:MFS transporter [Patescibacteria group bacterium]
MPVRLVTPTFIALAGATLVFYVASGIVIAAAPVFGGEGLGLSKATVGIAIAIYSIAALAMRPIVGWSTDRFGRRRSLLIGAALTVVGLLAHVIATNVGLFVVARCILGAGEAFWLVAALAAAADLAPEGRRGESLSFLSLTLYLGLAVGPWMGEAILAATGSFATVWLVTAAVATISLGLAWFVPETAPPADDRARPGRARPRLIHRAGLFPGVVILLGMSGMAYYLSFVPLYVRTIGLDGAGLPLAEYGLIVVALRIVGARLPDRLGAVALSGSALAAAALGLAIVAVVQDLAGLLVGTALFAFGVAFIMPALLSLTVSRVPPDERGTVVATATLFLDVSFGVAPVVLGGVAELGGYSLGFLAAGLISALGCVLLVVGSRPGGLSPSIPATLGR